MSMVTKRSVNKLPVVYSVETESDLNSDSKSFKGFAHKTQAQTQAQPKNRSPIKPVPVIYDIADSSIELVDLESPEVDSRPTGKRRRLSSSSDESYEPSCSASPEISCGGGPAIYRLHEEGGRYFIIKVPMTSKQETRRPQKINSQDISILLDSDNEDLTIFDSVSKRGGQVVGSLQNGNKYTEAPQTPKRSKKHLGAANGERSSPRGSPSRSKMLQHEEVSLKLKLRRSTEQSNYKIAVDNDEEKTRRSSTRSNKGTPKKCRDCDEDHAVHSPSRKSPQKTPRRRNVLKESAATPTTTTPSTRRTRRNSKMTEFNSDVFEIKSLHNKENESEADINLEEDTDSIGSRGRSTRAKSRSATPQLEDKPRNDTYTGTPRKSSKKLVEPSSPSRGYLETAHIIEAYEENLGTRVPGARRNEVGTPRKQTRKAAETPQKQIRKTAETPQKQIRKADEAPSTPSSSRPRRNSRTVSNYGDDEESDDHHEDVVETRGRATRRPAGTSQGTATPQKQRKLLEEAATPKRTPRRSVLSKLEESATPKRTPRRPVLENLEEPTTPKRTPRKPATILENDEPTTPKRTPRKPATILESDEPMTPSAAKRRNFKPATPSVKLGNLTPSMTRRTANVGKPKTILEEARAQLHVSTVPKSLPCRDDEFNDIFRFLESKLLDKSSGCIYISGVPGTGKTATVTEAIRALKRCVNKGELDNFEFIEINGMKLSEPRQAYVQILKQITGQTPTWEQAHGILDKYFKKSNAKRPMTLLLVDELDLLCNKRQDVVYNLLDWPATRNAHLVVITIANTMDLPERILMSRVTSRLGLTRLTFQPYTYKQLQEIVTARLKDSDAFRSEAIQLVARKVAAVSGDARRALDICRRATEITEVKGEGVVTMIHVNEALQEMISSAKVKAIKMCSEMEKYFLRAVDAEVTRTGVEEVVFQDIYRQLTTICSFEGIKTPNVTQALGICSRLSAYRLLLCEQTRNDADRRIILNVSSDDIHFAMQILDVA